MHLYDLIHNIVKSSFINLVYDFLTEIRATEFYLDTDP